ncbi:AraC family transcriptional regulator [Salibacterium salarium]|uniref:AraC family transcriptional regulator n=1 Tax=Salibacterium salarium TaxID=284579 RepID=A0A3R9PB44_9BACI|nr:AraC family transcriptional regulator [Salibacterium salarium]RSL35401.1 AraC family transcriptional regulator [Salibacterium salarium]
MKKTIDQEEITYSIHHYDEAIPIHKLVQFSGMNTSLFYRKFKHYTGFTLLQYITNKKNN